MEENFLNVVTELMWQTPYVWQSLIAGMLALLGATLAVAGLTFATIYNARNALNRERRERDNQRRLVAEARNEQSRVLGASLLAEISTITEFLKRRRDSAKLHTETELPPTPARLALYAMPATPVFDSRRGDLGLLAAKIAGQVAHFYSVLHEIQAYIEHVVKQGGDEVDPLDFTGIAMEIGRVIEEGGALTSVLDAGQTASGEAVQ